MSVQKILVVEDDIRLRSMLVRYLRAQGMETADAGDAGHARRIMLREHFDCVLLDLVLPGQDGLELCGMLRAEGNTTPIIMITAKGALADKVAGLETGADDYMAKPFEPDELIARIRAVCRRRDVSGRSGRSGDVTLARFGDFVFDPLSNRLTRKGTAVPLSDRECALLKWFVLHPQQPMSREHLMVGALGGRDKGSLRSIDVYVYRLRRRIEVDVRAPRYIQRVWGVGYVFVPDAAQ